MTTRYKIEFPSNKHPPQDPIMIKGSDNREEVAGKIIRKHPDVYRIRQYSQDGLTNIPYDVETGHWSDCDIRPEPGAGFF